MDLLVISTGHKWHKIDSQLGGLLLELFPENLRRVGDSSESEEERKLLNGLSVAMGLNTSPDPNPTKGWAVSSLSKGTPCLQFTSLVGTQRYDGPPEKAAAAFRGREIPPETLALYEKRYKEFYPRGR